MRAAANVVLYASIGGFTAAQSWPDGQPLSWKFWVAVALGVAVAVKALMSKGGESAPQDVQVVNTAADPVPTEPQ